MKDKPKIFHRIKIWLFSGAITAASLGGCVYGPPPTHVEPANVQQSTTTQKSEDNLQNSNKLKSDVNNSQVEQKSEKD